MNVLITSFQRSHDLQQLLMPTFSVAMYQPKGYTLPRVDWALIGHPDGSDWIRPRNFIGHPKPLESYREALMERYEARIFDAKLWFDGMAQTGHQAVAFCCWCPYDQAAQRQMGEHGSYVCHTDVLGEYIEKRLQIRCWFDSDRRHMKAIG